MNYGGIDGEQTDFTRATIAVLPVPFDGTSTWVKGADKGPEALLEASANMELYDIETDSEVYLKGIYTADPVKAHSPDELVEKTEQEVIRLIRSGKFVVTIGGEHSVSIGPVLAHAALFDNLTILQIDAHTDLRQEYEGSQYNHACVMARAREVAPIVQVGIRSMDISEKPYLPEGSVFWADYIRNHSNWMEEAISRLSENVYLTFDLDGLDPSILPSTGTPEPGGLYWHETIEFLKKVIESRNLVGFDVVELCPNPADKSSDFLASKLIYKLLSYRFQSK
ncbi:MAG: agmatinase [Bacteroidales bacterium]